MYFYGLFHWVYYSLVQPAINHSKSGHLNFEPPHSPCSMTLKLEDVTYKAEIFPRNSDLFPFEMVQAARSSVEFSFLPGIALDIYAPHGL